MWRFQFDKLQVNMAFIEYLGLVSYGLNRKHNFKLIQAETNIFAYLNGKNDDVDDTGQGYM